MQFPIFLNLPPIGDLTAEQTYAGIGRVIDQWEAIEFELSRTFSAAMGHVDGRIIPFYGENGRIFRERLDLLKLAVDHHFLVYPNQELEGWFDKITDQVTWYANHRNKVAHSVVYDLTKFPDFNNRESTSKQAVNFFAVPPLYVHSRNSVKSKTNPPYAFSSKELSVIATCAFDVQLECRRFRHHLFPDEWPEEQRAPLSAKYME